MSWLVRWMRAAAPTRMLAGRTLSLQRAAPAPWWSGRALVASVVHFSAALFSLVLIALVLGPQGR